MIVYHARLLHGLAVAAKFILFAVALKIILLLVLLPLVLFVRATKRRRGDYAWLRLRQER